MLVEYSLVYLVKSSYLWTDTQIGYTFAVTSDARPALACAEMLTVLDAPFALAAAAVKCAPYVIR